MINVMKRIPYLNNFSNAILILLVGIVPILNFWFFQDTLEIPKAILWYLAIGVLLWLVSNKRILVPENKWLFILCGAMLFFGTVGTIWSLDWRNSLVGTHPRYPNALIFFISWLAYIFIVYQQPQPFTKFLVYISAHTSILVSIFAVLQFFGFAYYAGINESARELIPSFLGNPNFSAMYVAVSLPLILNYTIALKGFYRKVIYGFLIGISLLALIILNSRGAYLGLIIGAFVYFGLHYKLLKSHVLVFGTVTLTAFILLGAQFYYSTRVDVGNKDSTLSSLSTISRIIVWEQSLNYFTQHPVFGTGYGNFFLAFRQNTHPYMANQEWFDDAHNLFVQNYVTNGVVYGTAFILFILLTIYYLFRSYQKLPEDLWGAGLITAIVIWSLTALFNPVPIPCWILFGLLIGAAWKHVLLERDVTNKFFIPQALKISGSIFIIIAVLILSGNIFLLFAERAERNLDIDQQLKMSQLSIMAFPFIPRAENLRINALISQGQLESADQYLQHAIAKHKLSSGIYEDASRLYVKMFIMSKNPLYKQRALDSISRMVTLNANFGYVYKVSSLYLFYLGEPDKALNMNTISLVKDPTSFNAWIMRGKLFYDLGERERVIESIEEANAITPQKNLKNFILEAGKPEVKMSELQFPYNF